VHADRHSSGLTAPERRKIDGKGACVGYSVVLCASKRAALHYWFAATRELTATVGFEN